MPVPAATGYPRGESGERTTGGPVDWSSVVSAARTYASGRVGVDTALAVRARRTVVTLQPAPTQVVTTAPPLAIAVARATAICSGVTRARP